MSKLLIVAVSELWGRMIKASCQMNYIFGTYCLIISVRSAAPDMRAFNVSQLPFAGSQIGQDRSRSPRSPGPGRVIVDPTVLRHLGSESSVRPTSPRLPDGFAVPSLHPVACRRLHAQQALSQEDEDLVFLAIQRILHKCVFNVMSISDCRRISI